MIEESAQHLERRINAWQKSAHFVTPQQNTFGSKTIHVSSLFDLEHETQAALWKMVGEVRSRLDGDLQPDGFNIGLNDGEAAGQTVMHAHIHVIPRWNNDVPDPRGGVRWIIPDKARYWGDK